MPETIPTDGFSAFPVQLVSAQTAQYWSVNTHAVMGPILPIKNGISMVGQSSGNIGSVFYAVSDGLFFYLLDEIIEGSAKKFDAMIYSGTDYTLGSGVSLDVDTKGAVINFSEVSYDWTQNEPAQLKLELWVAHPSVYLFDTIILDREYWEDGSRKYEEGVPLYKVIRPDQPSYLPPYKIWSVYMQAFYSSVFGYSTVVVWFAVSVRWDWFQWVNNANAYFPRIKSTHPFPHCTGIFNFKSVGGSWGGTYPENIPYTPDDSYIKVYPIGIL